jgi:superfamily II DNA or RNA helicase
LWFLTPSVLDAVRQKTAIFPSTTGLYQWQERALEAWKNAGRTGVVEAVTGAGKTRLALTAAQEEIMAGGRIAVVVPTQRLVEQWVKLIREHFESAERRTAYRTTRHREQELAAGLPRGSCNCK